MASQSAQETAAAPPLRRPGGRNERNRLSVAEAVLDFFREGRSDFSVAEVADRAGVHRSTVYRRWPTTADLLREALTIHTASLTIPDTGHWEHDLHQLAGNLATFFADPVEMAMNAAMASGNDTTLATVLTEHWLPIISTIVELVTRAVERKQIASDINPNMIVELLVSPLLMHTTFLREAPNTAFVDELARTIARASRP
jgi:AcrR family transcriptional regulator